MTKRLLLAALLAFQATQFAWAGSADADWDAIVALDAGPKEAITSREQAQRVTLAFLDKQEAALRGFIQQHGSDPRISDAELRLAHLLATRSDLTNDPRFYQAACKFLDEANAAAPADRKADFAFAKIALAMRRITIPTNADRDSITGMATRFAKAFPEDRRLAPLLVEVSTLYDNLPKRKEILLLQALQATKDNALRARIDDDMKRLALLGRPVTIQGQSADGTTIDSSKMLGKVVVAYFFASWSPPSVAGLDEVNYLRRTFKPDELEVIGISLDQKREAFDALAKDRKINWPVIWDGKGWEGTVVRSLSINAIPTLWIIDRKGNLRTLNALTDTEGLVRSLLKE